MYTKIKMRIFILSFILLYSRIYTLSSTYQEIIHENSLNPIAVNSVDGSVLLFSSIKDSNKIKETKLDKNGEKINSYIYNNITLALGDKIISLSYEETQESLLIHHEKFSHEIFTKLSQGKILPSIEEPSLKYFYRKSIVSLKNGKILIAGIEKDLEEIYLNIYDPKTNSFGEGISFGENCKMISCYEQKENQILCLYVFQSQISRLISQQIEVDPISNTIHIKSSKIIKTFFINFNYLKAIAYNETKTFIILRVEKGKYKNTEKKLFYYLLDLLNEDELAEFDSSGSIDTNCRYTENGVDETINVIKFLKKSIYIACETDEKKIKGYIISPIDKKVIEFDFNSFNATEIRNPKFAKFGEILGIFYTYINYNNKYNVAYHLMNYPNCQNYNENTRYLIPKYYSKEFDFSNKVYILNPYPSSKTNEQNYIIFKNIGNINYTHNSQSNLTIKLMPNEGKGFYSIEYVSTIIDPFEGIIEGKTCEINLKTPKCLEQCYSCIELGTDKRQACLSCVNDSYYKDYEFSNLTEYGLTFNCKKCNESCYSCYSSFILDPYSTTNCKICNYDRGYYHYINDNKTCISLETKDYWENILNNSIYLDKNQTNDKSQWHWRLCHKNCKKCSNQGTDDDNQCDICKEKFFFFYNQTNGNGIPGSCYYSYINNGFFLNKSEGVDKYFPCLDGCKKCKNENTCDECYGDLYLSPNNDSCSEDYYNYDINTQNISKGENSTINFTECEILLKKTYCLPVEEKLIIIKKGKEFEDLFDYFDKDEFLLFSASLGAFLPIDICKTTKMTTEVFDPTKLIIPPLFQRKITTVMKNGYDIFNYSSNFYNDICTPFTNEYGNDVLLDDRRKDYFLENINLCKEGCSFSRYNITTNYYTCKCPSENSNKEEINQNKDITKNFTNEKYNKKHTNSNIHIFKCFSLVFSSKGQKNNYGSYILLICLISFIVLVLFYFIKGSKQLNNLIFQYIQENTYLNPPKYIEKENINIDNKSSNSIEKSTNRIKLSHNNQKEIISEIYLNNMDFKEAKNKDKRKYCNIYWSLLKMKQLFIFTFYTYNDGILKIVKINLFILFISFYFAYTALFFNDKIMRKIYIYKGNTNASMHIPNIILSSLCCLIMNFFVKFIFLSGKDLINIKRKKQSLVSIKRRIKIKIFILFIFSFFLIILFWYYVSAFCAVFKNSQRHYFINVLISFIICNIWPCITSLIAPALRIYSIKNEHPCLYKLSKIISYI